MAARKITFTDTDENRLIVALTKNRMQLFVVDSEPSLEGDELRRFATTVFATCAGGPLAQRLRAARAEIATVCDQLAATGAAGELIAALERSLRGITSAADAITGATAAAPTAAAEPPPPPDPSPRPYKLPAEYLASTPRSRARDGMGVGWGWVRQDDDAPAGSVTCHDAADERGGAAGLIRWGSVRHDEQQDTAA